MKLKQATYKKPEIKTSPLGSELGFKALTKNQLAVAIVEVQTGSYRVNSDTLKATKTNRVEIVEGTISILKPSEANKVVDAILQNYEKRSWRPRIVKLLKLKQAELVDRIQCIAAERLFHRYGTRIEEYQVREAGVAMPAPTLGEDAEREIIIGDKRRLGRAKKLTKADIEKANKAYRALKRAKAAKRAFRRANKITGLAYVQMIRKHNKVLCNNPDKRNF